jgi:2'-hydroxyisoflavone reductase
MELLIAGGTSFVGRAIALEAAVRGHRVTVINRGRTPSDLPSVIEHLVGDRTGDLRALAGRTFDATVDTIAYRPADVVALANALDGRGGHHLQISSISAYADGAPRRATEAQCTLAEPPAALDAPITGATYGPLKAAAEAAAHEAFGQDVAIIRPTYIVGSHDPTGRFTGWVDRLRLGGEVLVPDDDASTLQWVDARDLAMLAVTVLEQRWSGALHAAGPDAAPRFADVLAEVASLVAPAGTDLIGVPGQAILDADVPSDRFPLWAGPEGDALLDLDPTAARSAGLPCRDLAETVHDVVEWLGAPSWPAALLDANREASLIAQLR